MNSFDTRIGKVNRSAVVRGRLRMIGLAPLILIGALTLLLVLPQPAQAACAAGQPVTVSNETELNNAIIAFNGEGSAPCDFTIRLNADILLTQSTTAASNGTAGVRLTIEGDGYTVDGQNGSGVRPFQIGNNTVVDMNQITVTRGNVGASAGGGILNSGTLTIADSTVISNTAINGGGGIQNAGSLTVSHSQILSNTVPGDGSNGGGIRTDSAGLTTIDNSTIAYNSVSGVDGAGGGVSSVGTTVIDASNISHNFASSSGGGIDNNSNGLLTVTNSTIEGNRSDNDAGGIANFYQATIKNSTIVGNIAGNDGGGIFQLGTTGNTILIRNSTISGNQAGNRGGGINVSPIDATAIGELDHVTIVDNTARDGTGVGVLGALLLDVRATIVAGNNATAGGLGEDFGCNAVSACGASVVNSLGFNVLGSVGVDFSFGGAGDVTGEASAPVLPLADNGGPTTGVENAPLQTHALSGPVAVDRVADSLCLDRDQRNYVRPNNLCDSGAFEAEGVPNSPPVAVDDAPATDEDTTLAVTPSGILTNDADVNGQLLTAAVVTGPSNGSLVLSSTGAFTYTPNADFDGIDTFTYVANDGELDSNIATVTVTVNPVTDYADLKLQKFVNPDRETTVGEPFTYTILVDNLGPSVVADVVVSDTLFASGAFTLQDVSDDGGGCSVTTPQSGKSLGFQCELAQLGVNERWTLTVRVVADAPMDVHNEARVFNDNEIQVDPVNANNNDTAAMRVLDVGPIVPYADLKLQKFVRPDGETTVGEPFTYTVLVDNLGPALATNVVVSDTLFGSGIFTLLAVSDDRAACSVTTPQSGALLGFQCELAQLGVNERWMVQARVVAESAIDVNNEARVFIDGQVDPNNANNSDTAAMRVLESEQATPEADLQLTKTSSAANVLAGERFNYRLAINNQGPNASESVFMTDTLPVEVLFESAQVVGIENGFCSYATGDHRVDCSLSYLPASQVAEIVINVQARADATASIVTNAATVAAMTDDPNPDNNAAAAETTLTPAASLSVRKVASDDNPATGDLFYYTIDVTNHGPSVARDVMLEDVLAGSVNFVYSPDAECVQTTNVVEDVARCTLGDLAPGETRSVRLFVEVNAWVPDGLISDNDEAHATTTTPDVNGQPIRVSDGVDVAFRNVNDLRVRKFGKPGDTVEKNEVLSYTIVVDNIGPGVAYTTTVTDLIVSDGSYSYLAPDYCNPPSASLTGNGQFTCAIGDLAWGEQFVFQVQVIAYEGQSLNNQANVEGDGTDLDPTNNHAFVEHQIEDVADVGVSMTVDRTTVDAGGTLLYTVVVTNAGPSTAHNVELSDNLPGIVTLTALSTTHGTCQPEPTICSLGNLEPGTSATVQLTAAVSDALGDDEVVLNGVLVTADSYDGNRGNNRAMVSTTVNAVKRMSLLMTSSDEKVGPGQLFTLRVTAVNEGGGRIENALVDVALGSQLRYVADTAGCGETLTACALGDLEPGQQVGFDIVAQMAGDAASGETVVSSSSVETATDGVLVDETQASVSVVVDEDTVDTLRIYLPWVAR